MNDQQRAALCDLVNYNYPQEEADAVENDMEDHEHHIYYALRILSEWLEGNATTTLHCPECNEPIWDTPQGHKLAKCWNTDGHVSGSTLAFDTME
jgi:hypothetical protein